MTVTIAELEARSGMTRANIRFYESEGFLSPARRENGYRDYSEADLEQLLRLKLLRALDLPLAEIRELQRGELGPVGGDGAARGPARSRAQGARQLRGGLQGHHALGRGL